MADPAEPSDTMPGIARKILICAAVDGLIIQPLSTKGQRPFHPLSIKYGEATVSPGSQGNLASEPNDDDASFEAFGIIGLITVARLSYLISITRRQQVAQIFGSPIYVVTEVAVTPCSSRLEAEDSIRRTNAHLERCNAPNTVSDDSEASDDGASPRISIGDEVEDAAVAEDDSKIASPRSSVAEDVMKRRGSYGRFAQSWFSRSGWTQGQQRTLGMSNSPTLSPTKIQDKGMTTEETLPKDHEKVSAEVPDLLPKLLRTLQVFFGSSRSFFFSYDFDLTRNLEKRTAFPKKDDPLYMQADSIFFWNRNLLQPFINAGHEAVALPVMQGFIGQRTFTVDGSPPQSDQAGRDSVEMCNLSPSEATTPMVEKTRQLLERRASEKSYTITLVSRRSTKRAGLRYLRRGINQDGFVANMVETEQLLAPSDYDDSSKVHSFLQIRGSIPLFFSQSPYAIKPVPVLQYSDETNRQAAQKHFERLKRSYGSVLAVNLVEKHGVESKIGNRYENTIEYLNRLTTNSEETPQNSEGPQNSSIAFEWFDFHQACRGMKFENVSLLLNNVKDRLESFGSTTMQGGKILETQKGIVRTNCMDCLDRTNVCQSSFARHMLEIQLKSEGFDMSQQVDLETAWFNTLWADNGDAVSKQYASTAAMKGDYTRTRKRDYRGALNDFSLSLARFYSGMVNDYFSQTAIDFLLGNVSEKVFEEFEADMMTKDPAISVTKMRQQAVELCQRRVIEDDKEEFHGGWALLSPNISNTIKSLPMEEVVLLLTDAAIYLCRFDWDMDKVSSFERVDLASVTGIKLGTYITSTISPSHIDPDRNQGFVVTYQPGKNDVQRTNTRTFSSVGGIAPKKDPDADKASNRPPSFADFFTAKPKTPPVKRLAFKAPYINSSTAVSGSPQQSELQQIATICAEIERLTLDSRLSKSGEERKDIIERGDIISLEEAKKNTGLLEQLGHSIKKLVWA